MTLVRKPADQFETTTMRPPDFDGINFAPRITFRCWYTSA
jgi:hypothetical protein